MRYCSECGKNVEQKVPKGDNFLRYVCTNCDTIHYNNPKIIVGSLPIWEEEQVLLCRRAIEPRKGFWTLPSGFMENKESVEEGAIRETQEEANANILIEYLHTLYNLPRVSQVYLIFKAKLIEPKYSCGLESAELSLCHLSEIPWDEIAFSSILYCLKKFSEDIVAKKKWYL